MKRMAIITEFVQSLIMKDVSQIQNIGCWDVRTASPLQIAEVKFPPARLTFMGYRKTVNVEVALIYNKSRLV